jgi:hypothetical protein
MHDCFLTCRARGHTRVRGVKESTLRIFLYNPGPHQPVIIGDNSDYRRQVVLQSQAYFGFSERQPRWVHVIRHVIDHIFRHPNPMPMIVDNVGRNMYTGGALFPILLFQVNGLST